MVLADDIQGRFRSNPGGARDKIQTKSFFGVRKYPEGDDRRKSKGRRYPRKTGS